MKNQTTLKTLSIFPLLIILALALFSCHQPSLGEVNLKPLVNHASKEDILKTFGKPDSVAEDRGETIFLYVIKHRDRVDHLEYNPATGRRQPTSQIINQWDELVLLRFDKEGILRFWKAEKM